MEDAVAQAPEDPSLNDAHGALDLRLVARLARPCGKDGGAVVLGHVLVAALDRGLVDACARHAALQVVGHHRAADALKERERSNVRPHEVVHPLRVRGLRERVVGGTEHGHEELDLAHLTRGSIDELRPLAGVVHEHLVAGDVVLPHGQLSTLQEGAVALAERRVLEPAGVLHQVLLVEQIQRHAGPHALSVDPRAVGLHSRERRPRSVVGVQAHFEVSLVERDDLRVGVEPRRSRAPHHVHHRRRAHACALGRLAVREPQLPLRPQNLFYVSHDQSLSRHLGLLRGQ